MKVVHITLHRGCANDFASLLENIDSTIELQTYFLHDVPNCPHNIYDLSQTSVIEWIWSICKDAIQCADLVVTSDTAPLARVLFHHQSETKGKVVVWVCNRIDYISPPAGTQF